ncbi:MAG: antitoxin VapB family protein [Thermoplasmatota archaeon]
MPFKTLTIKEDVYNKLVALKEDSESFSDLLDKLSRCRNVALLKKMRGAVTFEDKDAMTREIREKRKEKRYHA